LASAINQHAVTVLKKIYQKLHVKTRSGRRLLYIAVNSAAREG